MDPNLEFGIWKLEMGSLTTEDTNFTKGEHEFVHFAGGQRPDSHQTAAKRHKMHKNGIGFAFFATFCG